MAGCDQVMKHMKVSTITESATGSGIWTVTLIPSLTGPGEENHPTDVMITQVTVELTQGAGNPAPSWLFKANAWNLIGINVFN